MLGTKLVIFASAVFAGIIAHYGYTDLHWWQWYRQDIPLAGYVAGIFALGAFVWGLHRKD
jgi:hypothetical protein